MAETQLEAAIRVEGDVAVIDLQGDINAFAEATLINAYVEAGETSAKTLALNFNEVEYINSTGIALIVGLLARARKDKQGVFAFGLSDHFANIFEITRLSDFMQIVADEAAALELA
ncbi:MAG: STAS domain-containing protein [Chloroflexi bacterium]|nr:STAS domain-containing protein [Chloroflexota bacterium]